MPVDARFEQHRQKQRQYLEYPRFLVGRGRGLVHDHVESQCAGLSHQRHVLLVTIRTQDADQPAVADIALDVFEQDAALHLAVAPERIKH